MSARARASATNPLPARARKASGGHPVRGSLLTVCRLSDPSKIDFGSIRVSAKKVWRDICGCGQRIGVVKRLEPVAIFVVICGSAGKT